MNLTELEQLATETLQSLLSALDFEYTITVQNYEDSLCLMINSPQAKFLIGEDGDRLDDLQYLVNRSMQCVQPDATRVRVDCDEYRERQEEKLLRRARSRAESVLKSGKPLRMEPLNAYQRRLVHNALADMEGIATSSEDVDSRFKRIIISREGSTEEV